MTETTECLSCRENADLAGLPARKLIGADGSWRVAHASGTALPGWLVLVPLRHVTSLSELTDAEARGLGIWQVRASRALHEVTGCAKTYLGQFAEARGFHHVHLHLMPRQPDLAPDLLGPKIFSLLGRPEDECVPEAEMDALALRLRAYLTEQRAEVVPGERPGMQVRTVQPRSE